MANPKVAAGNPGFGRRVAEKRMRQRLAVETPRGAKMREVDDGLVRLAYGQHVAGNVMWERRTVRDMPREVSHPIILNKPGDLAGMEKRVIAHLINSGANCHTREKVESGVRIKAKVPYGKGRSIPVSVLIKSEIQRGAAPRNALASGEPPQEAITALKDRILAAVPERFRAQVIGGFAEMAHGTSKKGTGDVDLILHVPPGMDISDAAAHMNGVLSRLDTGGNAPIEGAADWRGRHVRWMHKGGYYTIPVHMKFEAGPKEPTRGEAVEPWKDIWNNFDALGKGPIRDSKRIQTIQRYLDAGIDGRNADMLAAEIRKMNPAKKIGPRSALRYLRNVPKKVRDALEGV